MQALAYSESPRQRMQIFGIGPTLASAASYRLISGAG